MLYSWGVSPATDASIVGDPFGPTNNVQVNNIDEGDLMIELNREYCDNQDAITGIVHVNNLTEPTLNLSDEVCENETLILDETLISNSSDIDLVNGNFTWEVNGSTYNGLGAAVPINFTGSFTIALTYGANQCEPVTVVHNMYAIPAPNGNISPFYVNYEIGLTISIQDDDAGQFSYLWSTGAQTPSITGLDYGNYSCTVTNNSGCSSVFSKNLIETTPTDSVTGTLQINRTMENVCGHYEWSASGYIGTPVDWEIVPQSQTITTSGTDNQHMSADFNEPGLYQVLAKAPAGQDEIYMGVDDIAIPVVPDFDIILECDPTNENNLLLTLDDQTSYLDNTVFTDDYWTIDNVLQYGTVSVPSGGSFTVELVKAFTYTHPSTSEVFSGTCSASMQVNTDARGQAAFSIVDYPSFCEGTPVVFNDLSTGDIIRWEWEFDDGASLIGQDAQRTYNVPDPDYQPSLTITDSYGCTSYAEQQIEVVANGLDGVLSYDLNGPFCSGNAWELNYNFSQNPQSSFELAWMPEDLTTTSNHHDVYQTGNYYVLLEDDNGCRAQSNMVNLGFVNTPTASIHGLTSYCPDENISLLGNVGDDFDYEWTITGPSAQTDILTTPNIIYTPDEAGIWTAQVVVINTEGSTVCSDAISTQVEVHQADPAPSIGFAGNACLSDGPVDLGSMSGEVYWSNGQVSTTATYLTPGYATAHTINPTTGCESEYAHLYIDPQPNFDGLLTGCYKKCKDWFPRQLYTYLTVDSIDYDWLLDGQNIQHDTEAGAINLDLPQNPAGFGTYQMNAGYGEGCHAISPTLTIQQKENCDDSCLFTKAQLAECRVDHCELVYDFWFLAENQCERSIITLESISSESVVIVTSDLPITLNPLQSTLVHVRFVPEEFIILDNISFDILVSENGNITTSGVSFADNVLENGKDCFTEKCHAEMSTVELVDDQSSFIYYFAIQYETNAQHVEVSTEVGGFYQGNPNYDPSTGIIEGLISFDETFVMNHMNDTSQFCFKIFACVDNRICITKACMSFAEFFNSQSKSYSLSDFKDADNPLTNGGIDQLDLHVTPNPATEQIHLTGNSCELVRQYCIYSLKGDILLRSGRKAINITGLKPGTYIIRADLNNGRVAFLKFIKQ